MPRWRRATDFWHLHKQPANSASGMRPLSWVQTLARWRAFLPHWLTLGRRSWLKAASCHMCRNAEKGRGSFTPERIEQWLETYPAEVLGLPNHTGSPAAEDPTGHVISTPIPDEAGPNIVYARPGEPTPIGPNDDEATRHGIRRENESAQILAGSGFNVLQNPVVAGPKKPDYLINGEVYDHYAPSTDDVRSIWSVTKEKVDKGQAPNMVIGLQDSGANEEALRRQFTDWPIEGLVNVLIVRPDRTIGELKWR